LTAQQINLDLSAAMDRGVPPSLVWRDIFEERPKYAIQLKAYTTVEKTAEELNGIADQMAIVPGMEREIKIVRDLATKILGSKRAWAEDFVKVVQKA